MEEFFQQGDLERSKGLPVTKFFDRANTNVPKCQMGFINGARARAHTTHPRGSSTAQPLPALASRLSSRTDPADEPGLLLKPSCCSRLTHALAAALPVPHTRAVIVSPLVEAFADFIDLPEMTEHLSHNRAVMEKEAVAAELERVAQLKADGTLSEEDFATAEAAILAGKPSPF